MYWPPGLPEPKSGNTFTTAETRLEHEGDLRPIQRISDPNYRQTLTLSFTMTEPQFRVFESWFFYSLCDGVSHFDMDWGGRSGRAQFTGNVQAQLDGNHWTVSGEAVIDYA